jgi:protein-disulfide isomerase
MELQDKDTKQWLNSRLASLNPSRDWKPDSNQALARLRERNLTTGAGRRRWIWLAAAAAAVCLCLLVLLSPPACANPRACGVSIWHSVFSKQAALPAVPPAFPTTPPPVVPAAPVQTLPANAPVAAKHPAKPASQAEPATPILTHYKESGSPTAPLACEVYTDYECPACAALYRDVIPLLVTQYVLTGKVKLLHRDFPLPQHQFAKLAARYANAAGELGHYDAVVDQMFRTQATWSISGDIDSQVAAVLPPGVMEKVREIVKNDSHLDETVDADLIMGHQDELRQTPTLVIVSNGKRQLIGGVPSYAMLQSYLDQLLAQH